MDAVDKALVLEETKGLTKWRTADAVASGELYL